MPRRVQYSSHVETTTCQRFRRLSVLSISVSVFLALLIALIGALGFGLFLRYSVDASQLQRDATFKSAWESLNGMVTRPEIMTSSFAQSISPKHLNLSSPTNETYELQVDRSFQILKENIDRVGADLIILWSGKADSSAYVAYFMTKRLPGGGHATQSFIRHDCLGMDMSASEILLCPAVDMETGLCSIPYVPVPFALGVGVEVLTSTMTEPGYTSPMPSCTDISNPNVPCDTFTSFHVPLFEEDGETYAWGASCAFPSTSLSGPLGERTPAGSDSVSFIVDLTSEVLVGSSRGSVDLWKVNDAGTNIELLPLRGHPSKKIEMIGVRISDMILMNITDTDASDAVSTDEVTMLSTTISGYTVDFALLRATGAKWVLIVATPTLKHFGETIAFGVFAGLALLFSILIALFCGTASSYCLSSPLERMQHQMGRVMELDFGALEQQDSSASVWLETFKLENSFWFLVAKLKEYASFLPRHFKDAELMHRARTGQSTSASSSAFASEGAGATDVEKKGRGGKDQHDEEEEEEHHITIMSPTTSTDPESNTEEEFEVGSMDELMMMTGGGTTATQSTSKGSTSSLGQAIDSKVCSAVWITWIVSKIEMGSKRHLSHHARLTEVIDQVTSSLQGVNLFQDATNWVVGFNAMVASPCPSHAVAACRFALDLDRRLELLDFPSARVYCGVVSGRAYCGIMGSNDHKSVLFFGQVLFDARSLAIRAYELDVPSLASEMTQQMVGLAEQDFCRTFPVDYVYLPAQLTDGAKGRPEMVYRVATGHKLRDAEWLYKMELDQVKAQDVLLDQAWAHLIENQVQSSEAVLKQVTPEIASRNPKASEQITKMIQKVKRRDTDFEIVVYQDCRPLRQRRLLSAVSLVED